LGSLVCISGILLKKRQDLAGAIALGSAVTLITLGLFDHYLWTLQQGRLILFLIVGIIAILYQDKNKELVGHE